MIVYIIQETEGTKNSPDSLIVMINYHLHSENRVINGNYHLWCYETVGSILIIGSYSAVAMMGLENIYLFLY